MFGTSSLDISRASWRTKVSDGSFFWIFHALSFEPNLYWTRNSPLSFQNFTFELVCAAKSKSLRQNVTSYAIILSLKMDEAHKRHKGPLQQ